MQPSLGEGALAQPGALLGAEQEGFGEKATGKPALTAAQSCNFCLQGSWFFLETGESRVTEKGWSRKSEMGKEERGKTGGGREKRSLE